MMSLKERIRNPCEWFGDSIDEIGNLWDLVADLHPIPSQYQRIFSEENEDKNEEKRL